MKPPTRRLTDAEFIELLSHEVALAAAEEAGSRPETPEEREAIDRLDRSARRLIRRLRWKALETIRKDQPTIETPIPDRIRAMSRDAVISRLHELRRRASATPVVTYRKLEDLRLTDLQTMLSALESVLVGDPSELRDQPSVISLRPGRRR